MMMPAIDIISDEHIRRTTHDNQHGHDCWHAVIIRRWSAVDNPAMHLTASPTAPPGCIIDEPRLTPTETTSTSSAATLLDTPCLGYGAAVVSASSFSSLTTASPLFPPVYITASSLPGYRHVVT